MPPISRPGELPGRSEDIASLNPQLVALARELILQDLNALQQAPNGSGLSPEAVKGVRDYVTRLGTPSAEPGARAVPPQMGPAGVPPRSAYEGASGTQGRPGAGPGDDAGMGQGQVDPWSAVQELVARLIREFRGEPAPHASEERNVAERPQDRFVGRYGNDHESQVATMAQATEIALSGNSLLREMYERGQLGRTRELIKYAESITQASTSPEGAGRAPGEAEKNIPGARQDGESREAVHDIAGLRSPTPDGTERGNIISFDSDFDPDDVRLLEPRRTSNTVLVAQMRSPDGGDPRMPPGGAASEPADPRVVAAASRSPGVPTDRSVNPDVPRLPLTDTPRVPLPQNAPGSPGLSGSPRL